MPVLKNFFPIMANSTSKKDSVKSEKKPRSSAFTVRASGSMPAIIFEIGVTPTQLPGRRLTAEAVRYYNSVWSTAANRSQISDKVIEELGLQPKSVTDNGDKFYSVDMHFPNKLRVTVRDAGVMDTSLVKDQADCVVGMDVIRQGDISISHKDNKTLFSFRAPPMGGVDYAEELSAEKEKTGSITMVRRNHMCPCGSGKKYKNCCGKLT